MSVTHCVHCREIYSIHLAHRHKCKPQPPIECHYHNDDEFLGTVVGQSVAQAILQTNDCSQPIEIVTPTSCAPTSYDTFTSCDSSSSYDSSSSCDSGGSYD